MPTYAVQFRRGTTIEHTTFIGSEGEITVNTDDSTLRLHDGETAGGFAFASAASILTDISQYTDEDGILLGTGTIASDVPSTVTNYAAYTKALVSTNAGGSAVEDKTGTHTLVNSGVTASNTAYKYATASMYFDGSSYLQIPAHEDLVFGVRQPFTLETWVYPTDSTNDTVLIAQDNGTSSGQGFRLTRKSTGVIEFLFWKGISRSSSDTLLSTGSVAENEWTHLAVSYDGQTVRLFVNGVEQHSKTPQPFLYSSNQHITFGSTTDGASTNKFIGYLEDVRMINGVSVYSADFTVPTTTLTYVATSSGSWYGDRGIAVFGSGGTAIEYFNIPTPSATSTTFGNLTSIRRFPATGSNGTYGVAVAGYNQALDDIDYFAIATPGAASNFGLTTRNIGYTWGSSDGTTMFYGSGGADGGGVQLEHITIGTSGTATQFISATSSTNFGYALSNANKTLINGLTSTRTQISYFNNLTATIAEDWGDLVVTSHWDRVGASNETYGLYAGGNQGSTWSHQRTNAIDYVAIDTLGQAGSFGTLSETKNNMCTSSNGTLAAFAGGQRASSSDTRTIEYVNIGTSGNASDWGDLIGIFTEGRPGNGQIAGSPS